MSPKPKPKCGDFYTKKKTDTAGNNYNDYVWVQQN